MKSLVVLLALCCGLLITSCTTTTTYYYGSRVNVNLTARIDPQTTRIVVLPSKSSGKPDETISWEVTDKFEQFLRQVVGFTVIDRTWVEAKINELKMDATKLTVNDMKRLKKELNVDYLFISKINYNFEPGSSSSSGYGQANSRNANVATSSYAQDGYYSVQSESVSIIDPESQITALTAQLRIDQLPDNLSDWKGYAYDISWGIRRHIYNEWPK